MCTRIHFSWCVPYTYVLINIFYLTAISALIVSLANIDVLSSSICNPLCDELSYQYRCKLFYWINILTNARGNVAKLTVNNILLWLKMLIKYCYLLRYINYTHKRVCVWNKFMQLLREFIFILCKGKSKKI